MDPITSSYGTQPSCLSFEKEGWGSGAWPFFGWNARSIRSPSSRECEAISPFKRTEVNLQGRVTHRTGHGENALVKRRVTKYDGLDINNVTGVKRYDLRVCEKTELLEQFQIIRVNCEFARFQREVARFVASVRVPRHSISFPIFAFHWKQTWWKPRTTQA
jgi:hypothetical protein